MPQFAFVVPIGGEDHVIKCMCQIGYMKTRPSMDDLVNHIFLKLVDGLEKPGESTEPVAILRLLYSYLHASESMEACYLLQLINSGLVYHKGVNPELASADCELVHERQFVFKQLCQTAESHRVLFSRYDLGGAQELLFSDCCQRGQISATCFGTCRTISGRAVKPANLYITCINFCEQVTIGAPVQLPTGPTCCLIKLAPNHPAIDFIIYKNEGGVRTRVLYFIQISAQTYQSRQKKFDAVLKLFDSLGKDSPYKFYRNMFNMNRSTEVYYIYSTPAPLPSDAAFTNCKKDKDRVYFHKLD